MFTGLVESLGVLRHFTATSEVRHLFIEPADPATFPVALGDSVAVNGCCLTVADQPDGLLRFDLLAATLRATNLGDLAPGSRVNLERALAANARLGGHFVQGHVDGTCAVLETTPAGPDLGLRIELRPDYARYLVAKGSIALNGVSLTIAQLGETDFQVWIIPHTRAMTNLGDLRVGDRVNFEVDVLAKYAERLLAARA